MRRCNLPTVLPCATLHEEIGEGLKTPVQTTDTNIISILLFSQPPQTQRPWLKRVLCDRRSQSAEAGAPASEDEARHACKRCGPSFKKDPPLHAPLLPLQ